MPSWNILQSNDENSSKISNPSEMATHLLHPFDLGFIHVEEQDKSSAAAIHVDGEIRMPSSCYIHLARSFDPVNVQVLEF